ncbi:MAG: hypothetical protein HQL15_09395 [Candidatus Omnitrophica bacterium]|nr:hypothetical protein [Candidatus Omnitrophota bacterium]
MELINFDIRKNLEELESMGNVGHKSSIVSRGQKLRKIAVKDFSNAELRTMIEQNSSLKYLLPLAISRLHVDSLLKGEGYEGDMLNAVLTVEKKFWMDDLRGYIPIMVAIIETALAVANSKPTSYEKFLQHSSGAIRIFKVNVGLM